MIQRLRLDKEQREKWMQTLTVRQVEVLAAAAFGEVELTIQSPYKSSVITYTKWMLDGVDVGSVVTLLKRKKMLRARYVLEQQYLIPTDRGWAEIEARPHLWTA